MDKFQNAKIYKITSSQITKCYIGSTTVPLSIRFSQHKHRYLKGNSNASANKLLQFNDAKIELIEDFPCKSKNELFEREGFWIKQFDTINNRTAGRTRTQYYLDNKDKINIQAKLYHQNNLAKMKKVHKTYYENNKDEINKVRGTKITCYVCNREFRKDHISKHNKTKIHLSNLG